MKKLFIQTFVLLFSLITAPVYAQAPGNAEQAKTEENGLVKWLSFEEAFALNQKQPKPFLIDIYTDWCGWCKHMMRTTYSDPGLAGYINAYFYPVKLNAETKDTIEYLGTKYFSTDPSNKKSTHQLAIKLLGTSQSYPSTIFLGNNLQFSLVSAGYMDVRKIEPLLIYMVENIFRTASYDDFSAAYKRAFPEDPADTLSRPPLNKYSMQEALRLHDKQKRKIIININTAWCNGCKVMSNASFRDSAVARYLNEKFYFVDLNAESKDPITFGGVTYENRSVPGGPPFHDFVLKVLNNNIILPTTLVWDEDLKQLDAIPFFIAPQVLSKIVRYYGDDAYKTVKWQEYAR